MEWTEIAPTIAAAASVGLLIVAVVALCSRLVSRAIDKQGEQFGRTMDRQGEQLGKAMDRQGEQLGKAMDRQGEQLGKAIDEQARRLEKYEQRNADEHAALGRRIDKVENKVDEVKDLLHEVHIVVVRLDERQQAAEKRDRQQAAD